jgi:hypothetical protein
VTYLGLLHITKESSNRLWACPCYAGSVYYPLYPQLMLWFTYYKGTFSTFVFASQNRSFMLRSVLRTLRPYIHLTQKTYTPRAKTHLFVNALAACRAAKRWRSHERSETRKAAAAKPQRPNVIIVFCKYTP